MWLCSQCSETYSSTFQICTRCTNHDWLNFRNSKLEIRNTGSEKNKRNSLEKFLPVDNFEKLSTNLMGEIKETKTLCEENKQFRTDITSLNTNQSTGAILAEKQCWNTRYSRAKHWKYNKLIRCNWRQIKRSYSWIGHWCLSQSTALKPWSSKTKSNDCQVKRESLRQCNKIRDSISAALNQFSPIYINEHLTSVIRKFVWVRSGRIFVRKGE